jgi:sugar/nucleoside kinase (ribokinase family)
MKINELFEKTRVTEFLNGNYLKGGVVAFDANIPKEVIFSILDFYKERSTEIIVFEPTSNVKSFALFDAAVEYGGSDATSILSRVSIITPNAHELKVMARHAKSLLNLPSPIKFVDSGANEGIASNYNDDVGVLLALFPVVVLKLGRDGVIVYSRKDRTASFMHFTPLRVVEGGNTSGAGDTLVGTLVSEISRRGLGIDDLDVGNREFAGCVENAVAASVKSVESLEYTISRELLPFE